MSIVLTDLDIHILKKCGLTKKDISFLTTYMTDDEMQNLINQLKKNNAKEHRNKQKQKIIMQIKKKQRRNYEKECKCAVGAIMIDEMFKKNIITSYDDILKAGTNELTDNVHKFLSYELKIVSEEK